MNTKATTAPYGSWKSPITSQLIVADSVGLSTPRLDGDDLCWLEQRPTEGGRTVLVRRSSAGETADVTPAPFNVRTRVHEYGGGAYLVSAGTVYISNFANHRLYALAPGAEPRAISPDAEYRYADYVADHRRNLLYCVREDHTGAGEAVNTLVTMTTTSNDRAGKASASIDSAGDVIVSGNDFYSTPRLSPDGTRLAWLTWNHPNMPFDGTELWIGELDSAGTVVHAERVAGDVEESIFQPEWSPDGELYFVSDRSGWWNLYRRRAGTVEAMCPMEAEFGLPQWSFGVSTYGFESVGRIICTFSSRGLAHLASIDTTTLELKELPIPYTFVSSLRVGDGRAIFIGASPDKPGAVVLCDTNSGETEEIRRESETEIDAGYISIPQEIEFPTEGGLTAFGFYYPPANKDFVGPVHEPPLLIVKSHGGPTGATSAAFDPGTQYWTSRGFAVLDVNYGGSTGYGRDYRMRLVGRWGIVDVDDCVNGARTLVDRGLVDGERLIIKGGSAGGFTTLCALTFRDVFKAGASYFGVGDLEALAKDTHKFESRYLDSLVGPYPEQRDLYRERSAIHHADLLSCPLILFQGSDDRVVSPEQSRSMYESVKGKGIPVAYLEFEGEQHGFRAEKNITRSLEAELYFYSKVFGFALADEIEPVRIDNL